MEGENEEADNHVEYSRQKQMLPLRQSNNENHRTRNSDPKPKFLGPYFSIDMLQNIFFVIPISGRLTNISCLHDLSDKNKCSYSCLSVILRFEAT